MSSLNLVFPICLWTESFLCVFTSVTVVCYTLKLLQYALMPVGVHNVRNLSAPGSERSKFSPYMWLHYMQSMETYRYRMSLLYRLIEDPSGDTASRRQTNHEINIKLFSRGTWFTTHSWSALKHRAPVGADISISRLTHAVKHADCRHASSTMKTLSGNTFTFVGTFFWEVGT